MFPLLLCLVMGRPRPYPLYGPARRSRHTRIRVQGLASLAIRDGQGVICGVVATGGLSTL